MKAVDRGLEDAVVIHGCVQILFNAGPLPPKLRECHCE